MVSWLSRALSLLAGREKSRCDQYREASDSFALNLHAVLLRLCDPIMKLELDRSWPLLTKVKGVTFFDNVDQSLAKGVYLKDAPWLRSREGGEGEGDGVTDVTSSTTTTTTTTTFPAASPVNFPTQCFFLTARSLHLSLIKMITTQKLLYRQAQQYGRSREDLSQALLSVWLTRKMQLLHPDLLSRVVRFCSFTSSWILREIGVGSNDDNVVPDFTSIALTAVTSSIPQQMVEDLVGMLDHLSSDSDISNNISSLVPGHMSLLSGVIKCLVVLLSGAKSCITSPHVRASIGDVIHECFFSTSTPILPLSIFSSSPLYVSVLLPSLLQLYGDVEPTGFYAAVAHRAKLTVLIKHLLSDQRHRDSLIARVSSEVEVGSSGGDGDGDGDGGIIGESKSDSMSSSAKSAFNFISTANGVMNQANSAITDGLSHLQLVKEHQVSVCFFVFSFCFLFFSLFLLTKNSPRCSLPPPPSLLPVPFSLRLLFVFSSSSPRLLYIFSLTGQNKKHCCLASTNRGDSKRCRSAVF